MTKIHVWQESLRPLSLLVKLTAGRDVAAAAVGRENSRAMQALFSPASKGLSGKRPARYYRPGARLRIFSDSGLNSQVSAHVSSRMLENGGSKRWELVRRCKQDDRQAFQELVERYQRKAVAIALGMLHDREDALEVAQEAFTKVFSSIRTFQGASSFYTWLYRIVVNLSIDRQRQRSRRSMFERHQSKGDDDDDWTQRIPDTHGLDPSDRVAERELGQRIRAAINELTPAHKAVILLWAVEGLSYEEISQVLQCSRGTVMSRLHYARKKLQKRLGPDL